MIQDFNGVKRIRFGVSGFWGLGVQGLGFWGSGFRVLGFRVWGLGCLVVSLHHQTAVLIPKKYSPHYRDPRKGTPSFGEAPTSGQRTC